MYCSPVHTVAISTSPRLLEEERPVESRSPFQPRADEIAVHQIRMIRHLFGTSQYSPHCLMDASPRRERSDVSFTGKTNEIDLIHRQHVHNTSSITPRQWGVSRPSVNLTHIQDVLAPVLVLMVGIFSSTPKSQLLFVTLSDGVSTVSGYCLLHIQLRLFRVPCELPAYSVRRMEGRVA